MFNKKKIFITISILFVILSLSVLSIFAFEFRQPTGNGTMISPSARPSLEAVQNLVGIINFQTEIGQLRASSFKLVYWVPGYGVYTIVAPPETTASLSFSGDSVSITFSNTVYQYVYQDGYGFLFRTSFSSLPNPIQLSYFYYSDYPVVSSSFNFTGFNSQATFGTNYLNTYDSYSYYEYIYNSCIYREERESTIRQEAQSEGESIGFEEGAEAGYSHGYDQGFESGKEEGYSEGESVGYNSGYGNGFDAGNVIGYETGFDDGYRRGEDIGYESGFDVGYDTGYSEGYSEGYETGYNIVYDDLQQPGTIEAIFTTKDSSGNTLYLAQEMDIANLEVNYQFLPKDQLSNSYVGYRLYVKTYDVTKYLEDNPLDFDYPLPVLEDNGTDFLALYRKVNVTREYFDLYSAYSFVEVTIDQSFIDQLANQYNEGLNDANALVNGIGDIATKPIVSLKDALDFEIFGLNIGVVAVGIVAILFAIWAYNKIRKVLPI